MSSTETPQHPAGMTREVLEEAQRCMVALINDALSGESFCPDSTKAFQRVFNDASAAPAATADTVFGWLNEVGAAVNRRVFAELARQPDRRPEPIGTAAAPRPDGSCTYYMFLAKDTAALMRNQLDVMADKESATIIKLGPFVPTPEVDSPSTPDPQAAP